MLRIVHEIYLKKYAMNFFKNLLKLGLKKMTKVAVKSSGIWRGNFFGLKFQKMAKKSTQRLFSSKYFTRTSIWSWRTLKKNTSSFPSLNFKIPIFAGFAARENKSLNLGTPSGFEALFIYWKIRRILEKLFVTLMISIFCKWKFI